MYSLIGRITATKGERDLLAAILVHGMRDVPGCLSYAVAPDSTDEDVIWITEVWDSPESQQASLSLSSVQKTISRCKPFIAEIGERLEATLVTGQEI